MARSKCRSKPMPANAPEAPAPDHVEDKKSHKARQAVLAAFYTMIRTALVCIRAGLVTADRVKIPEPDSHHVSVLQHLVPDVDLLLRAIASLSKNGPTPLSLEQQEVLTAARKSVRRGGPDLAAEEDSVDPLASQAGRILIALRTELMYALRLFRDAAGLAAVDVLRKDLEKERDEHLSKVGSSDDDVVNGSTGEPTSTSGSSSSSSSSSVSSSSSSSVSSSSSSSVSSSSSSSTAAGVDDPLRVPPACGCPSAAGRLAAVAVDGAPAKERADGDAVAVIIGAAAHGSRSLPGGSSAGAGAGAGADAPENRLYDAAEADGGRRKRGRM